jgi:hypothetical protein
MAQPQWVTPAGSLGTIPEGVFYSTPLVAVEPVVTIKSTSGSTTGTKVTFNFAPQRSVPFDPGTDVFLTGFTPSDFNGTYTVLASTGSSITVDNTNGPAILNLKITAWQRTGSSLTLDFFVRSTAPFVPGQTITLTGFTPSSYNKTYVVSSCTTGSVTVSDSQTTSITKLGNAFNAVFGNISNTPDEIFYELIAGNLPSGIQIQQTGLINGVPKATANVQGTPTEVSRDVTSKFAVRAYTRKTTNGITVINRLADRTFELTVVGQDVPEWITPAGQIAQYFDGSLVEGLQLQYTDTDPDDTVRVKLVAGQLPPGLTLSSTGLISGFIAPNTAIGAQAGYSRDGQGYDQYPYDFSTQSIDFNYEFVLEVSDGKVGGSSLRTFSIFVWSRNSLTADNTIITADNTFITADGSPIRPPIILNPQGSIGSVRNDNFFAYQFNGIDLDGDQFNIIKTPASTLPPGLTLDPNTGWLYGYIPNLGITENTYNFSLLIEKDNDPDVFSGPYDYSLSITGPISSEITWLTDSDLGSIFNGSTSTFYVQAVNAGGLELQYRLLSGSNSSLPQGLELLSNGDIAGRVSFNTFAVDGGTTTFDVTKENGEDPTTFDMTFTFVVNAFSVNGIVNVSKTFTITVIRAFNEPYENLYIECMPPQDDRILIDSLIQNSDIFPPDLVYRPNDPNFGVAKKVVYNHAYGLTAATIAEYYSSLYENHYWKNLVLGPIKTAQARDGRGNVIYEVVYSEIVDDLVNNQGESVSKQVELAYPIDYAAGTADELLNVTTVYPNSLINMRDQVIDVVGQISNILPSWMTSKQSNGQILGFTPAWVIAYVKPGQAERVAYYINTQFGQQLNLIDFEVDRYELDRSLTKNWDPVYDSTVGSWIPNPPSLTTFDVSPHYQLPIPNDSSFVFDGGIDYAIGDQILINGSQIGGQNGAYDPEQGLYGNDVIVTVQDVDTVGTITQAQALGLAPLLTTGDTYTNIAGTNLTGTGATFTVSRAYNIYQVQIATGGSGYHVNQSILIPGTVLGGISPLNDATVFVDQVTQSGAIIKATVQGLAASGFAAYTAVSGTAPAGSGSTWDLEVVGGTATTFDGGSMQFTAPVDMYSNTQAYDKYLVFPKRNILQ